MRILDLRGRSVGDSIELLFDAAGIRRGVRDREGDEAFGCGLVRTREARFEIVTRADAKEGENPEIVRVVASTDDVCDMGWYDEKLVHEESAIDRSAAVSVLLNHDRNQIIGRIRSTKIADGKMEAELEIDDEVRGTNGLNLKRAIKRGYVKGVSIGYDYKRADVVITENDAGRRTLTANRWMLREISITPTQADVAASVKRSLPESWIGPSKPILQATKGARIMGFNGWLKERGFDPKTISDEQRDSLYEMYQAEKARAKKTATAVADPEGDEVDAERKKKLDEREKALAKRELVTNLRGLVQAHCVELTDEEIEKIPDEAAGLRMLLERKGAKAAEGNPKTKVGVDITRDAADKANDAAEDGLLDLVPGFKREKDAQNLGMRGGSVLDIGRRWLQANGVQGILQLDRRSIAKILIGKDTRALRGFAGLRDAANVTSGMFTSFVLANVMDKVVYGGFMAAEDSITYPIWTAPREVEDFKQFSGAALDLGNLQETAENVAFPELAKEEGGYNGTLGLWGGTIGLTLQALANDDLGEFMRWLGKAGFIARRTVDVKVYTDLEGATWTNRTTAGNLSDANVNAGRASLSDLTGPAGQKLGITARYLIVPSGLRGTALTITQIAQYIAPTEVKVNTDLEPVITPHLTTKATPANSEWYLAPDKNFDPVVVATLRGVNAPMVEEYDAGAVAARKWKIMYPFVVVIPTVGGNVGSMWNYSGT